jgi:hypothetical protein
MCVTSSYAWHFWDISASRSHPSGCRTFSSMSVVHEGKAARRIEDTRHLCHTRLGVIQSHMLLALLTADKACDT